jgi:hypothetical protein
MPLMGVLLGDSSAIAFIENYQTGRQNVWADTIVFK